MLIIEQIYTGCLAQGAYYIQSDNEVAIIDPLREIKPYMDKAERNHAHIKYVLETHFHADFVSGHVDLAKATGAQIVFGPTASPQFDAKVANDGEILELGSVKIKVLHTPGHTMESTCFLLIDENGKEQAIFTGDTLFIGDVGRPDLAQKGKELTMADLATHLFNSLRNKIMTLPGELIVYPGHGAGSACGKKMSNETQDTLANQIATNYALRTDMTVDEFVNEVTHGLVAPPAYFPLNVKMNKEGYSDIHQVISNGTQALSPNAFELVAEETGALILDTRNPEVFVKGFIPNSINIGLDGSFAPWVGALIPDIKQQILLVCEEGREEEAVIRLARVGYDFTIGFLEGGINAWKAAGKELDTIESISAETFAEAFNTSEVSVLDVRKSSENFSERIPSAENTPLDFINDHLASIKPDHTYYVHCAGGYRSVVFISILQARGYRNLINVEGGFKAIKATEKVTITDYVCPSTEL